MSSYYTLNEIKNYKINSSELKPILDIFSWEKKNKPIGAPACFGEVANMYLSPNIQYYYFTTIQDNRINNRLLLVNHLNFASPLSRDLDSKKRHDLCKVLSVYDNNYSGKATLEEGIWVVEQLHIPKDRYEWSGKALSFFGHNKYVANDDSVYRERIAAELEPLIKNIRQEQFVPEANFVVLYFIPKQLIINYMDIFIPKFNILLTRSDSITEIKHPSLIKEDEYTEPYKVDFSCTTHIRYEVVKHITPSAYEFYYVKIGNEVISITPIVCTDKAEGCYKYVMSNGIASEKTFSPLEDMGREFGVYRTKEEAMYNGDPNKELELNKQELDRNKLEIENKKLEIETEKINLENSKLKFDYEKLKLEYEKIEGEAKRIKLEHERLELETEKIKLSHAQLENDADKIKLEGEKLKMEKEKLTIDLKKIEIENKILDIKLDLAELDLDKKRFENYVATNKAGLEFNLYKRKVMLDLLKISLEMDNNKKKHKLDNVSKVTTAVNTTLNGILTLIRAFN